MNNETGLSRNALSFIALALEYCQAIEGVQQTERDTFIATATRLLPRLYIAAADIENNLDESPDEGYIDSALSEDAYDQAMMHIAALLGEDDTYLEVFQEDMKYSDTPIGATISEGMADLYQVFYNFLLTVRDAPNELILAALSAIHEDFKTYWSAVLCNVMRPLNQLRYNP